MGDSMSKLIVLAILVLGAFPSVSGVSGFAFGVAESAGTKPQSQQSTQQKTQAAVPQSFEVASIKPSAAQAGMSTRTSPDGRYSASGITAKMLIQQAYGIQEYQISGGPSWVTTERYDVNAKADMPEDGRITREQMNVLLQSLLAERFHLQIHRETKELPIYALLVAKNGPKLKQSEIQPRPDGSVSSAAGAAISGSGGAGQTINRVSSWGGGVGGDTVISGGGISPGQPTRMGPQMMARGVTMSSFATTLARTLGRPVVDKTALPGAFDIDLEYAPGLSSSEDASGPSIFTALQEQLGLRLESQKGPVEILIIDLIDKPSGN
jgi:uncharacterized protein (TIGR03435 family)